MKRSRNINRRIARRNKVARRTKTARKSTRRSTRRNRKSSRRLMRTARRANRRVSMRGGAPFSPEPGDTVSFYKRNDGVASYISVDKTNSTLATGIFVRNTPGGMYIIKTPDGEEHMSNHIGDIPNNELIGKEIKVNLPPTYGRPPGNKDLTVTGIKPYSVEYARGLEKHIYNGIDEERNSHSFYASDII